MTELVAVAEVRQTDGTTCATCGIIHGYSTFADLRISFRQLQTADVEFQMVLVCDRCYDTLSTLELYAVGVVGQYPSERSRFVPASDVYGPAAGSQIVGVLIDGRMYPL